MGLPRTPASTWVVGSFLFYSLMALVAAGIARWRGAPWHLHGGAPAPELLGGLALGGLASALCYRWRERPGMRAMAQELGRALGPLRGAEVLAISLASGVGEELLFRGALQPWLGLVPTSILFAAMHPPITPALRIWPWMALLAGCVLGGLALGTGGLLAPIGLHAGLNAGNMAWIVSMEGTCASDTSSSPS